VRENPIADDVDDGDMPCDAYICMPLYEGDVRVGNTDGDVQEGNTDDNVRMALYGSSGTRSPEPRTKGLMESWSADPLPCSADTRCDDKTPGCKAQGNGTNDRDAGDGMLDCRDGASLSSLKSEALRQEKSAPYRSDLGAVLLFALIFAALIAALDSLTACSELRHALVPT
jgi:hypothetical protein